MKKLTFLFLVLVLTGISGMLKAQVSGYTFSSTTGTYTPITGGTVLRDGTLTMDSWTSAAITIPSFTFNGVAYTTAYVTSNGLLNLGGTAPSTTSYTAISSTTGSGYSICPFNADLDRVNTTASTEIRWETVSNEIIFQWTQVKRYGVTESFDFQVRLNTTNGQIKFVYQLNSGPAASTSYQPQVGIRTSATDYNNRLVAIGTEDWVTSLPGTANNNTCRYTSAAPAKGFVTGLTYTWTAPTCLSPTAIITSNITTTGADISWTAPAMGSPINYEWKVVALGAGSGGAAVASGSTVHPVVTASASGLTTATPYDIFVRTDCGAGDFSAWAGPVSFTTLCTPSSIPYSQNFETAVPPAIPICTSVENAGTGNLWTVINNPGYGFTSNTMRYLYNASNNANAWFYTQGITLNSGTSYRITFRYGNNSTTYTEKLKVAYGLNPTYTAMTNVLLDFPSINLGTPQNASFDFIPASTGVYFIGFNAYSDANQYSLYVDDIIIDLTPSCPAPTALNTSNITSNSAQIGWTNGGSETEWYIIYGAPGFDPLTEGTLINTGITNPYVLSGLTSATAYQFYVKAICGVGDESAWAGPFSFTTLCNAFTTPFTEGFESAIAPPVCWTMAYANASPPAGNLMTHSTDIAFAGTRSFRFSSFSSGAPYNEYLISPELSYTQSMQLTFQYRCSDPYEEVFAVGTSTTGNNYTTDFTWGTDIIDASDTEWKQYTAIIPAGTKYVAIQYKSDWMYYLYIDEFNIQVPPTCNVPTALSISNITTTGADISWTAPLSGTPSGYEWLVVAQGDGTTGTPVATGTTTHPTVTANATGLTPSTPYDAYVRTFCGGSDYSVWVGPFSFSTLCSNTSVPYSQNFETATPPNLPLCTSGENAGTGNLWTVYSNPGNGFTSNTLRYQYNSTNNADAWFYTQGITLNSGTSYKITFKYGNNSTTYTEKLKVAYGLNPTYTAMTNVLLDFPSINQATPQNAIYNFTPTATGVYYIGFNAYSDADQYSLYVDDIIIELTPSCPAPTVLTFSNVTSNSAQLGWTNGGSETEWYIIYGAPGFNPATEGTLINTGVTNPYTLNGLTAQTPYEFYVKAICGVGNESLWAGPSAFMTSQVPFPIPFTETFEIWPNGWSVINGTQVNQWNVGSAVSFNGTQSAYISNDLGVTNAYNLTATSVVHAFRDIQFPNTTNNFNLKFNWKGQGEGTTPYYYDYLSVYLVPTSTIPVSGTELASGQVGDYYNLQATWQTVNLELPSATYANQTMRLVFTWVNDNSLGTQPPVAVDDIAITEITCNAPTVPAAGNITTTSADLNWTNGGTETEWYIIYGAPGFNPATEGTLINTGVTNPYTLTGLTGATTYSFYVKAICGVGDESIWAGPYTFTTGCDVYNAPFSETFDGIILGAIPMCWSKIRIHTSISAVVGAESSNSPYTTPYHLRIYNSWTADAAAKLMLITPELANITSNQIRFYAKASTAAEPLIIGTITDPTNPATFTPFDTITNLTTTHTEYTIKFDTYLGTNTYIAFSHGNPGAGTGRSIFIDNFIYEDIPTCFNPTNIVLSGITTSSVIVSWTAPTQGTPVSYTWKIVNLGDGPNGTAIAQGIIPHPTTTVTATGLSPSTTYELWMRTECGGSDYSAGAGPIVFSTLCTSFSIPFNEEFDATIIPACWSQTFSGTLTSNRWNLNLTNIAGSTPNEMRASFQSGTGISRLISPALNTTGLSNLLLSFITMYDDYDIGASIKIQSSTDGITWTDEGTAYPTGSGDLPAGTVLNVPVLNNLGGTTYIAWVIDGDHYQYDYWYIDSVVIKVPNTQAEILTFDIPTQVSSTINSTNATVNVVMPYGTDPTILIPTFTLSNGATAKVNSVLQQSGVTSNNYTSPLVYNVRAENLIFVKNWTVTVTVEAGSSDAEILTFDIPAQISSTVTSASATVDVVMPYGTDLSSLTPTITISANATIDPLSGIAQDFTSAFNYEVTAQDATIKDWTVNVTNELSNEAEILTFSFAEETGPATINSGAGTISIEVTNGTNLVYLVPTITISPDATIDPATGIGQDFTSPFVYTVTAQDGTIKTWTVTVTEAVIGIVYWTFPNNPDDATAEGGIPANIAKTNYTVGANAASFGVSGITTNAATATGWDNGADTKYWETEFVTTGYNNIRISSVQKSSGTGPKNFKLQYQVGAGAWTDLVPAIVVANDLFISGAVNSQTLPSDANNQPSVKLRWIMTDNTSVGGGTVGAAGTSRIDDVIVNGDLINPEAEIIAYTIPSQVGQSVINSGAATVNVNMLYGTDVTALIPSFVLSTGATADITGVPQVSGTTPNNFTTALVYTVTAEDGTTTKDWTVTVTVLPASAEAEILTYTLPGQVSSTVNSGTATVAVVMPYGSDVTNLIADFTLSIGANAEIAAVPQVSGITANDFTASLVYHVTAEDAVTTKDWTVNVTFLLNDSAEIWTFDVPSQVISTINSGAATVDIIMPFGTDVTALVPAITISTGATVNPASGTAQDFTNPVVYTVTAENGTTTKDWTVTVTFEDFIDLAIINPPYGTNSFQFCDGSATSTIDITIENTGNTVIAAGEQITVTANIDGTIENEILTLAADMNPGETIDYTFLATFDLSGYQVYNFSFSLSYTPDQNSTNDTADGTAEHITFDVEITNGDFVSILSTDFPYTLTLTDTYNNYEWTDEIGNVISVNPTASVTAFGTYYISVSSYGDCNATDSIVITDAGTDLTILIPAGGNIEFCDGTTTTVIQVLISNVGTTVIAAGEQIEMTATIDATTYVETLTLTSDMNPSDDLGYAFIGTFDLSAFIGYNYTFSLSYAYDANTTNDTVTGIATHILFTTEITQGDTLCLQVGDFPYTLTLTGVADNYEWTDSLNNVISNSSSAVVNDFGWYYLEMWNTSQTCWVQDSILVLFCVDAESTVAENTVNIYPNPSNGMVYVSSSNPVTYEVTTVDGKTIRRNNSSESFSTINLNGEAKGIYFIKVISNNATSVHKVVIE